MFYAWCCIVLNFEICRHHTAKINHLFVKLNVKNGIKMILFNIPSDLFP
jgi:hypothetical protein